MHGQGGELSTKIINNKNRKEFYLNQTSPEVSFPDYSGKTAPEKQGFPHSFLSCQNKEHEISNMTGVHSFKVSEETGEHVHSKAVWPWCLGREAHLQRRTSMSVMGRRGAFILSSRRHSKQSGKYSFFFPQW